MDVVTEILAKGKQFGWSQSGEGQRILVEFVSVNPTGPLHVGHGRQGAYGSVIADLLATQGYEVIREYNNNEAGRQMDILAASVWIRYLESLHAGIPFRPMHIVGRMFWKLPKPCVNRHGESFEFAVQDVLQICHTMRTQARDSEFILMRDCQNENAVGETRFETCFSLPWTMSWMISAMIWRLPV